MVEWILGLISKAFGVDILAIGMFLITFNLFLGGVQKALQYIADKTETDLDNKALMYVNKAIKVIQKIVDLVGFNPEHKKK